MGGRSPRQKNLLLSATEHGYCSISGGDESENFPQLLLQPERKRLGSSLETICDILGVFIPSSIGDVSTGLYLVTCSIIL